MGPLRANWLLRYSDVARSISAARRSSESTGRALPVALAVVIGATLQSALAYMAPWMAQPAAARAAAGATMSNILMAIFLGKPIRQLRPGTISFYSGHTRAH